MHSRPRVSLLSLHYPPEPTGNAPYAGALAEGLARRQFSINAQVAHPHYPEWKMRAGYGQWARIEVIHGVTVVRRRHYVPNPPRGLRRLLSEASFGVRLISGRWGQPDAVIAASPALVATALATLRIRLTPRRPALITWVQDLYSLGLRETGEGNGTVAKLMSWLEARTLRAADKVVTIHPRFADYIVRDLGVPPSRVRVIRNWTHLPAAPEFDRTASRISLGWPTNAALAVHTGNMGAKQGLENVIEAARLADEEEADVCFVLVGNGGERSSLELRAEGVTRIRFVDPLGDDDYRRALAAADVLIVNEKVGVATMAVPSKLTSYFDAARPVVAATALDGITAGEISASGAGTIVPAGEPRALLEAVLGLVRSPAESARLGRLGRRYRDNVLSEEGALSAFETLVCEVVREQLLRRG